MAFVAEPLCWWLFQCNKSFTNISKLSPTYAVSNIRHQHRWKRAFHYRKVYKILFTFYTENFHNRIVFGLKNGPKIASSYFSSYFQGFIFEKLLLRTKIPDLSTLKFVSKWFISASSGQKSPQNFTISKFISGSVERPESARPSSVLVWNFSDLSNQRPIQSQIWSSSIVPGTSKGDDGPSTTSPARLNLGLSFPLPDYPTKLIGFNISSRTICWKSAKKSNFCLRH